MKPFALVLTLAFAQSIQSASYCDDLAVISHQGLGKHGKEIRRLRQLAELQAVWLGLCRKVRDGSISQSRAASIFEEEGEWIKRVEERTVRVVLGPFG